MPHIIDTQHPQSRAKGSIWKALCGETVWSSNDPYPNVDEAIKSGGAICLACRKVAGIPVKRKAKAEPEEPFVVYSASHGRVQSSVALKETPTGFRLESGELLPKKLRIDDSQWRLIGASDVLITRDKEEAFALAQSQINRLKEYADKLPVMAADLEEDLKIARDKKYDER